MLIDIYPASSIRGDFGIDVDYDCAVFFIDVNADNFQIKLVGIYLRL